MSTNGQTITDWLPVGSEGEMFCRLTDLELLPGQKYDIVLRSVNNAGLTSDPITTSVTVGTQPPVITGTAMRE